jgi:hypothetical protein
MRPSSVRFSVTLLAASACSPLDVAGPPPVAPAAATPPSPVVPAVAAATPTGPHDETARGCDRALALNGVDAYVSAPVATLDPFVKEATLSAWVSFSELPSAAGRIFHIVGKSGFARDLDLQAEKDDHFHFYVATGAPNAVVSRVAVASSTGYRVVATYSAGERIALYVNGALEAERAIPGVIRQPNHGPITVGENVTFNGRYFHGFVDDVALWSRAWAPAEVAGAGHFADCSDPTLVAAYGFDGNARDCSAHHFDGQLGGGAAYAPLGGPADCKP